MLFPSSDGLKSASITALNSLSPAYFNELSLFANDESSGAIRLKSSTTARCSASERFEKFFIYSAEFFVNLPIISTIGVFSRFISAKILSQIWEFGVACATLSGSCFAIFSRYFLNHFFSVILLEPESVVKTLLITDFALNLPFTARYPP